MPRCRRALFLSRSGFCSFADFFCRTGSCRSRRFVEAADTAGLSGFHLTSGDSRKRYIVEANSAGVCVLDYDSDGRPIFIS